MLIFRRIKLYTCSIWYCHSLWEFLVACSYTAWVRTNWKGKVVGGRLKTSTNNNNNNNNNNKYRARYSVEQTLMPDPQSHNENASHSQFLIQLMSKLEKNLAWLIKLWCIYVIPRSETKRLVLKTLKAVLSLQNIRGISVIFHSWYWSFAECQPYGSRMQERHIPKWDIYLFGALGITEFNVACDWDGWGTWLP